MNAKQIVETRNPMNMAEDLGSMPKPDSYVITGPQAGNINGEDGWENYIGYVVQIRKGQGAFGSNMVFLRHPNGELIYHENQFFYYIESFLVPAAKKLFKDGYSPEEEDLTQPITIGGKYPEYGKVIEYKEDGPPVDESPLVQITVQDGDSKNVIIT